ncbi:MAG: hypothetical protein ACRD15_09000 [Vicinamibacterales bacterium]
MILIAVMALSLAGTPQQPAAKRPAPLQLHDQSQKILRHEQELLKAAESEHRADGAAAFEVAMQLSRVAAEAADAVSVMSDLTSIEQRLACAADRSAVSPTVQARLSYTVRRLDLLIRSVSSHLTFTKSAGIGKSAKSLLEALQESRTFLAALLRAR